MSADFAIQMASRVTGVRVKWIKSRSRCPRHVSARRLVAEMLQQDGWSTTEIGLELDRDHSTIVSLLNGGKGRRRKVA